MGHLIRFVKQSPLFPFEACVALKALANMAERSRAFAVLVTEIGFSSFLIEKMFAGMREKERSHSSEEKWH